MEGYGFTFGDWIELGGVEKLKSLGIPEDHYLLVNGYFESRQSRLDELAEVCKDWLGLNPVAVYFDEEYGGWILHLQK